MKLTILGTGNALVTKCYNTCFVLEEPAQPAAERYFLVDGGGGNGILTRLEEAKIDWQNVRDIFVTHRHMDHIMGIFWMIRRICQAMSENAYEGEARIYSHPEVLEILRTVAPQLLQKKQAAHLGERLQLLPVADGETRTILGHEVQFFDIHSTKATQFGFSMALNRADEPAAGRLTCCGDEPFSEPETGYVQGSRWLLHEAFCLAGEAEKFHPYEKHHSTVEDACAVAERLGVENLILYHTEQTHLPERKALYTAAGRKIFSGNLFVPDDMEQFEV